MTDTSPQTAREYPQTAAAYGAYVLIPALMFGGLLAVQLARNPGAGWLAIVAGCAAVALALLGPSPRRRRAAVREFLERLDPAERTRWEARMTMRGRARRAIVLAPPTAGLLGVFGFAMASLPWRDPTLGEAIAVVILAAGAFGTLTWAAQWLAVGWPVDRGSSRG
jgi:hypothetical protein